MLQWQARKISHATAYRDLVLCRDPSAQRSWQFVQAVKDAEEQAEFRKSSSLILARAPSLLSGFRGHPAIDNWMQQFHPSELERLLRFRPLLLRGRSRTGKTSKAMSLFGISHTLSVNCQGLGTSLPSIRGFDRSRHRCIVWDEVTPEQVLANKLMFQSGPVALTLAQSACGAFQYDKYLYGIPQVLCSNEFVLEGSSRKGHILTDEESDWLRENIMVADLLPGEAWFEAGVGSSSASSCGSLVTPQRTGDIFMTPPQLTD
jgi:hypothetical protein